MIGHCRQVVVPFDLSASRCGLPSFMLLSLDGFECVGGGVSGAAASGDGAVPRSMSVWSSQFHKYIYFFHSYSSFFAVITKTSS